MTEESGARRRELEFSWRVQLERVGRRELEFSWKERDRVQLERVWCCSWFGGSKPIRMPR